MMKKKISNLLLAGSVVMGSLAIMPIYAGAASVSTAQSEEYLAPYSTIFTEVSNNKTFTIKKGATFAIRLDENISTGYSWVLEPMKHNISFVTDYAENVDPGADSDGLPPAGRGGARMFIFKAHSLGVTQVQLKLVQPWMNIPAQMYSIKINIIN